MHIVTEKAKHFCGDPELLAHRMTCRGVPGCSVALLQEGQVTHSAVSGAAGGYLIYDCKKDEELEFGCLDCDCCDGDCDCDDDMDLDGELFSREEEASEDASEEENG